MLRGISGRFMFFTAETARAGAADRPPYQNKTTGRTPLKRQCVEYLCNYSMFLSIGGKKKTNVSACQTTFDKACHQIKLHNISNSNSTQRNGKKALSFLCCEVSNQRCVTSDLTLKRNSSAFLGNRLTYCNQDPTWTHVLFLYLSINVWSKQRDGC